MTILANAAGASSAAIRHHYDVGNDFYALWLDESLTYSCGLWYADDESLEAAQVNKIDWHLDQAGVVPGSRVLDVGCGWGGLMRRAVQQRRAAAVVGLSLSEAQVSSIGARGIPRSEARLESWREHRAESPFDAIVSIGAFEHFASLEQARREKITGYREFFAFCHRCLRPGGRLSLQSITYEKASRETFSRFFAERIFPESDLPHLHEIFEASTGLFEPKVARLDRQHYSRTAECWLSRLRRNRAGPSTSWAPSSWLTMRNT